MIHGTTVRLFEREQTGTDDFGAPIYAYVNYVDVADCLVGQPTAEEVTNELNYSGRRIAYVIGVPKGDMNDWENTLVKFDLGDGCHTYRTFGIPEMGIEANIPLRWHKKVRCERYE